MRVRTRLTVLLAATLALPLAACTVGGRSTVTLTVDPAAHGAAIPDDFVGLSFETGAERPGNARVAGYFFSPADVALVTLFQNLGIGNLRMGGGSVDDETPPGMGSDGYTGIDNLFAFAQSAGADVIYSLRLLNPSGGIPDLPSADAAIAQHIWRYRSQLSAYAIGNEPDWKSYHRTDPRITDYPSYLADWQDFADTILGAVPAAKFVGPDTGAYTTTTYSDGQSWTQRFASDQKGSDSIAEITQHHYVGASPGATTSDQAIDDMLSSAWVSGTEVAVGPEGPDTHTPYPWLYAHNLAPVVAAGLPYRLTEANEFVGGVAGASDTFASALWALDYLHWWAEHGAAGVDFHNKQWILTDTIVPDPNPCVVLCRDFQTAPKGYGIKAFNIGGHGYSDPVTLSNPGAIPLTAYAVGAGPDLYVTVINKTHGTGARAATVRILPKGVVAASVSEMVLTDGQPGDAALPTASLGGAPITNNRRWTGLWTPLPPLRHGRATLTVQPTTAAIVRIHAAGAYSGPVALDGAGTLEVVGDGAGGSLWIGDGTPSAWTRIPGETRFAADAVVAGNPDGALEAFAATAAGEVEHSRQRIPGGGWGAWQSLGGKDIADLAVAAQADGSLAVFGIGADGDVVVDSQDAPGVGWTGWADLGGQRIAPGFAVGRSPDGLLDVLGADAGGHVWSDAETGTGMWAGWKSLGGDIASNLAVAAHPDGRLGLFGLAPDGTVWHNGQKSPGGPWQGWRAIRGRRLHPGFVVGEDRYGRLMVFGVGSGDHVWTIRQRTPGAGWGRWMELGTAQMRPTLAVGNTANGNLQLLGTGINGDVWTIRQQTSGRWGPWTDLGGTGLTLGPAPTR